MTVSEKRKTVKKAAENAVKTIRREIKVLFFAYRDPRTPWYAKAAAAVVLGYALSPVDLIPDFIPFLGYCDDLLIIPAGLYFVWKMIPSEVIHDAREKAEQNIKLPVNYKAAFVILLLWGCIIAACGYYIYRHYYQTAG